MMVTNGCKVDEERTMTVSTTDHKFLYCGHFAHPEEHDPISCLMFEEKFDPNDYELGGSE